MRYRSIGLAAAMLMAAGCSSSSNDVGAGGMGGGGDAGGTPGTGGVGGSDPSITYPLLDCDPLVPEFCGYPFPSNVYTVEDASTPTGRRVSFSDDILRRPGQSEPWDRSDGFSAGSPILTFLPGLSGDELAGEDDIGQSLTEASATILLDAETGELMPHFAEIDVRPETIDERSLVMRPAIRLKDGTRYIVAARSLTNESGDLIEPSPVFTALRNTEPSEDEDIETRRALYEDIFAKLEEAGWARDEVQIAWDFTTASDENNTQWLLHMRDEALALVEAEGGVQYRITSVREDYRPEWVRYRIEGEYRVPLYTDQAGTGAVLNFGEDGMPEVNAEEPWVWVPFNVFIPQSATLDDPGAIVEYGHGLFGAKEEPTFGGAHQLSFANENNYVYAATDLWGMAEEDRDATGLLLLTGEIGQLRTLFDRLHQGFLNHVLLLRMMKTTFAADDDYGPYIKADEAYYYGISQGGIMGAVVMALTSDVERGALGVMGMPYSLLLFRATGFAIFLDLLNTQFMDKREHQLFVGLIQMLWDRAEPNGYAHHVTENPLPGSNAKNVMLRAAIADHQVSNLAAHVMARTMKLDHLDVGTRDVWGLEKTPSTETGENFYVEYDFDLPKVPACNTPMILCEDPHEAARRRVAARSQLDEFLRAGTGSNYCDPTDGDSAPAAALGVCSYPSLSGCMGETDEDAQALCTPGGLP